MKKLFIIFAALICLTGCKRLKQGTIVGKYTEPSRVYLMPIFHTTGKITTVTYIPVYDNEDYCIIIKGVLNGDTLTQTVYTNEAQYNCLSIGEGFTVTKDCSFEDNNNN